MTISVQPFGDRALLIAFPARIEPEIHRQVIYLKNQITREVKSGLLSVIPAYHSLTLVFEPQKITFFRLKEKIERIYSDMEPQEEIVLDHSLLFIPVCYEPPFALDLEAICERKSLRPDEVIELHTRSVFQVFMLGFQPGFPYLGILPESLQTNRLPTPRLRVPANSVGIAGQQTGVYPLESPGGWQILGQTPLSVFNPHLKNPFLFQTADRVQFYAISPLQFKEVARLVASEKKTYRTFCQQKLN